jgi:hypothetical protein
MLISFEAVKQKLEHGKKLFLAGDEQLLKKLPKGNWIGGTIPYFMDSQGGVTSRELIFNTELPDYIQQACIKWYTEATLPAIPEDAPENGVSLIIIPAMSKVHSIYAQDAPNYTNIFMKPIIGWIAGIHLDDLGKITPKVFNGQTGEFSDTKAIVLHLALPADKIANINIINLFTQGSGDLITFKETGFKVQDCFINGKERNFVDYLLSEKINTQLPLVANYDGTLVNVSFQKINEGEKSVDFYAPVFSHVEYRIAKPVTDYVSEFLNLLPKKPIDAIFSCNCILNYLYSKLEGKQTGNLTGPITFGEIAYQLLNQTLVYLEIN